jgi:hypothetical protein
MPAVSDRQCHEALAAFPEITPPEYEDLKSDIKRLGQLLVPIVRCGGRIMDGRARLQACQELGIEPQYKDCSPEDIGDPYLFVDSLNLHRRHLTQSQRAIRAARSAERFNRGRSLAQAAKRFDVSPRYVSMAAQVSQHGEPELIAAVESGEVSVPAAVHKIRSADTKSIRVETPKPKPQHQKPTDSRPAKITPTDESVIDAFGQLPNRLNTILRLIDGLHEHERIVVADHVNDKLPILTPIYEPEYPEDDEPAEPEAAIEPEVAPVAESSGERELLTDELINSPAMYGLAGSLDVTRAEAIGIVRLLYAFTQHHAPAGDIGQHVDVSIAGACAWKSDSGMFIRGLVESGWLVRDVVHRLLVVDWPKICPKETRSRLAKLRECFAEPIGQPDVKTTTTEKRKPSRKPDKYSEAFERFWSACSSVRKTKKAEAWKAWKKAVQVASPPDGQLVEDWIIERMDKYAKSYKGQSEYCQQPSSWLNGGCYDDDDAAWGKFKDPHSNNSVAVRKPMKPIMAMVGNQEPRRGFGQPGQGVNHGQ